MDTRDMRRALSSTSKLSLAYCASLYTDAHAWKEGEEGDAKGLVFTSNLDELRRYNSYDCSYTARVYKAMLREPEWKEDRVQRIYRIQREKARIAAEMHTAGIPIDRERYVWANWALWNEIGERKKKLIEAVGIDGFRGNEPDMRAIIYEMHAKGKYKHLKKFQLPDPWDPQLYTDPDLMDTCSVDEDSLTILLIDPGTPQQLKDIIELWWDLQVVKKQRSTFVHSKLVRQAIGDDWHLRPGWNSCGTDTYRFSCSEPNVLNIEKMLRWMYRAKPGRKLVGSDWQQLEIRVMEAVANDRALRKAIESGDVYSEDAKAWFGLPADADVKKDHAKTRKACKIMHLGCQYWAGAATVHRQALRQDKKFKWELTKMLHAKFPITYSDTKRYWEEEFKFACENSYSASRILDRRRYYSAPPTPNEAVNYPVQSTASDIADLSLLDVDKRLKKEVPDARIVVQQYDNIMVDCREQDVETVKHILRDGMEVEYTIDGRTRPFPVDIAVGDSWDEA